ncbi:RrF2 family transcriptional regulator [Arhodomonas sp. AD133]|uniref:RrF2 family transcriptional regulator n=1 Tax=Arhodomonas sp. AD133 TaxID=3415009 RepID=UPI003EB6D542
MRLTLYSDYCLRVLMYLGTKDDGFATIKEIAEHHDISRNHLMKVVYGLSRSHYITTIRGKNGGMRLARSPDSVNLGTLIRETEHDCALVECFGPDNQCAITAACRLRGILNDALKAFFAVLDDYTLADLLTGRDQMRALLGIDESPVHWGETRHG